MTPILVAKGIVLVGAVILGGRTIRLGCVSAQGTALPAMIDLYTSFAHLETHEVHGTDFRVRAIARVESPVLVLAPHGGGIEIGTSQLAARVARRQHSLFTFEGLKPPWQNRGLHITSHNFDHPRCLEMLALQRSGRGDSRLQGRHLPDLPGWIG